MTVNRSRGATGYIERQTEGERERERKRERVWLDHEGIRLVIPSSLRLLNFPPFHPSPRSLPTVYTSSTRERLWRRASKRRAEGAGSRLHKITRMPSHLFSCHHGCSRDIKRQFKDDWTMTHDTPAMHWQDGAAVRFLPLLSLYLPFLFSSLRLSFSPTAKKGTRREESS